MDRADGGFAWAEVEGVNRREEKEKECVVGDRAETEYRLMILTSDIHGIASRYSIMSRPV